MFVLVLGKNEAVISVFLGGIMLQQQTVLSWLKDAHAMEVGAIPTLKDHASAAEHYPDVQAKLNAHIGVTHHHAELVASCIERLGGQPSALKEAVGGVLGKVTGLANLPAKDTVIKNALGDFAAENFEIICYQSLVAAAEQLGDRETASVCRQILQDEQDMAAWLMTNIASLTQRFLSTQTDEANAAAGRANEAIVPSSDKGQQTFTKTGTRTTLLTLGALLAGAGAALLIGQALKGSSKDVNETLPEQYPSDTDDELAASRLIEERIAVEASDDKPAEVTTDLLAVGPGDADLLNQNNKSALMTELLNSEGTDDSPMVATELWLTPGPYTGMGPKAYDSAGDPIGQEAALRLTQHGQVDASNIEITVDNSEVLLEGTVGSDEAKRLAEEAVRSLSGVKNVQNLLQVHA